MRLPYESRKLSQGRRIAVGSWIAIAVIIAVVFFTGYLAFAGKASVWILIVAAALLGVFANLDRVSEFSASLSGIGMKLRDLDNAITEVRRLAIVTGGAVLGLQELQDKGGIRGVPARTREGLRQDVLNLYANIGVDKAVIDELKERIAKEDLKEYVFLIPLYAMRHTPKQVDGTPLSFDPFNDFSPKTLGDVTPDMVRDFLIAAKVNDPDLHTLLLDYQSLYAKRVHSDPDFWADRDRWAPYSTVR